MPHADSLYVRGTVTWDVPPALADAAVPANPVFQLRDLDVNFPRGQMTLIAGKFGSGKTLLLLSLLGEVRLLDGKISYLVSPLMDPGTVGEQNWSLIPDGVAYVPQVSIEGCLDSHEDVAHRREDSVVTESSHSVSQ